MSTPFQNSPHSPESYRAHSDSIISPTNISGNNIASPEPLTSTPADEDVAFAQLRSLLLGDGVNELEDRMVQLQGNLAKLEKAIEDPNELLDRLVPIGVDLISREISESSDDMCQALMPIIDRVIYERSLENREAMARAISIILPAAIQAQINEYPQTIAHALGPEISAAIREQVSLKRGAVADALAEEMGVAIRRQIDLDRNAMVDALYPVIGRTINKYLQEVIQDINEKVSNSLSAEGISRRIRAKTQGVSEAELILRESANFQTRAIFLIHKESGLVIAELQGDEAEPLESDMLAGMLTAIRSFVEDCAIADDGGSELKEIEYGTSKILLEVAGYCYLAVLVAGEVPKNYQRKLRRMLGLLVQRYGQELADFDGDIENVPQVVNTHLEELVATEEDRKKTAPPIVTWVAGGLAIATLGLTAFSTYRHHINHQLITAATQAVAQDPTLGFYNVAMDLEGDRLVMRGRVPSENLRTLAEHRVATAVTNLNRNIEVENQVRAVKIPTNPDAVSAEVYRTIQVLNQREGVNLETTYRLEYDPQQDVSKGIVTVNGDVGGFVPVPQVKAAIAAIPGVDQVITNLAPSFPKIGTRLYFSVGSANIITLDRQVKLKPIQTLLERSPQVRLKITGYSPSNEPGGGQALALERARIVRQDLIERGIDPSRLEAEGQVGIPKDLTENSPDWAGRCVGFLAIP